MVPLHVMKRLFRGAAALALLFWPVGVGNAAEGLKGHFPEDVKARFIFRFDALPNALRNQRKLFRIDAEGHPTLLLGRTLVRLEDGGDSPESMKLQGRDSVDDYLWTEDGALLAVSRSSLVLPGEGDMKEVLALPDEGMSVAPAGPDKLYLYGGTERAQRLNLYIYRRGGRLTHLAKMPYPITAVSGDGTTVFAAVGRSIMAISTGKPVALVHRARHEVASLAIAPPWGLFYATRRSVGYLRRAGQNVTFLEGRDIQVQASGDALYLLIPDKGILKTNPISAFEEMADELYR